MCPHDSDTTIYTPTEPDERTQSPSSGSGEPAPLILIVDDDPVVRSLMRDSLEDRLEMLSKLDADHPHPCGLPGVKNPRDAASAAVYDHRGKRMHPAGTSSGANGRTDGC